MLNEAAYLSLAASNSGAMEDVMMLGAREAGYQAVRNVGEEERLARGSNKRQFEAPVCPYLPGFAAKKPKPGLELQQLGIDRSSCAERSPRAEFPSQSGPTL